MAESIVRRVGAGELLIEPPVTQELAENLLAQAEAESRIGDVEDYPIPF